MFLTFLFFFCFATTNAYHGDEELARAYDSAVSELREELIESTSQNEKFLLFPLECVSTSGLRYPTVTFGTLANILSRRSVTIGIFSSGHTFGTEGWIESSTKLIFGRIADHYGVNTIDIVQQTVDDKTLIFSNLLSGSFDMIFLGNIYERIGIGSITPNKMRSGCVWNARRMTAYTPRMSPIFSEADITPETNILSFSDSLLVTLSLAYPNQIVELTTIEYVRKIPTNANVIVFILGEKKINLSHFRQIETDNLIHVHSVYFRRETTIPEFAILGEPDELWMTGNSVLKDIVDTSLTYELQFRFIRELNTASYSSFFYTENSLSQVGPPKLEGTLMQVLNDHVIRIGCSSGFSDDIENYFHALVISMFDRICSLYQEGPNCIQIIFERFEHFEDVLNALENGHVEMGTNFGTLASNIERFMFFQLTYINIATLKLVTLDATSLSDFLARFTSTVPTFALTNSDEMYISVVKATVMGFGLSEVSYKTIECALNDDSNALQAILNGEVDALITTLVSIDKLIVTDDKNRIVVFDTFSVFPNLFFFRNDYANSCGNSVIDFDLGEQCDGGLFCDLYCQCSAEAQQSIEASQLTESKILSSSITACERLCGNGELDEGEECDKGIGCGTQCLCLKGYVKRKKSTSCISVVLIVLGSAGCLCAVFVICFLCILIVEFISKNKESLNKEMDIACERDNSIVLVSLGQMNPKNIEKEARINPKMPSPKEQRKANSSSSSLKTNYSETSVFEKKIAEELGTAFGIMSISENVSILKEYEQALEVHHLRYLNLSTISSEQIEVVYTSSLSFGSSLGLVSVDSIHSDFIEITNKSLTTKAFTLFLPSFSKKYSIIFSPRRLRIHSNETKSFEVKINFNVSTVIHELISLVYSTKQSQSVSESASQSNSSQSFLVIPPVTLTVSTKPSRLIDPDTIDFNSLEFICEGSTAHICKTKWKGSYIVLKLYHKQPHQLDLGSNEISILSSISHPQILSFIGFLRYPMLSTATEFAPFGSLDTLLGRHINLDIKAHILYDVARGMAYLHEMNIIHLDINPKNVLIFSLSFDASTVAKICDFGTSRVYSSDYEGQFVAVNEGTMAFVAPEIFEGFEPTPFCDVYSFAVTAWCVFTQCIPYQDLQLPSEATFVQFIIEGGRPNPIVSFGEVESLQNISSLSEKPCIVHGLPDDIANSLELWWNENPQLRTDFTEIVSLFHSFLSSFTLSVPLKAFKLRKKTKSLDESSTKHSQDDNQTKRFI